MRNDDPFNSVVGHDVKNHAGGLLKAGALYFVGVFAIGFVLGAIRTLWVVPALGTRAAELIESPIMLLAICFVARSMVRHHGELSQTRQWLAVGLIALALLLVVEFTVVLRLRGLSISEYFATRDPVSGTVYYLLLGVFAVMPFLMFRQRSRARGQPGVQAARPVSTPRHPGR